MTKIRWAPRVPMEWLQRLYELDGAGIVDEELIDKVGYRLYERCRDCIAISDISVTGRVSCPMCRVDVDVTGKGAERSMRCRLCGWSSDWPTFHSSFRHMELFSSGMRDFFDGFVRNWEKVRTPKDKMLAIDDVIHRWHWENALAERGGVGRPGGVNLIEGSRKQVLAFLDRLSSGPNHDRWARFHEGVQRLNEKSP